VSEPLWLGLDPVDSAVEERHLEHVVLDLLAALAVEADLVLTHVVRSAGAPRTAASVRLTGRGDVLAESPLAALIVGQWSGAFVLEGSTDGPTLEHGPHDGRQAAGEAVAQGRSGESGRAALFPGQDALVAPLPVSDVPLVCAIAAVLPVVGQVDASTLLDPSGYVRPRFAGGRLLLEVVPGPGGVVVPAEQLEEHACAGH